MTLRFLIAIDGGGTGTRARLCAADGRPLAQGAAGPSSLSHGVAGAWRQILEAIGLAFEQAGLGVPAWSDCALGAGLAGANDPAQAADFRASNPGFTPLVLDTDSFTALVGAHAGRPGLVLIAGTGSVAEVWRPDGSRRIAGGWGFPVGDEGSGAWLGLQAVRLAQQVLDGRAATGPLAEAVCTATGRDADSMLAWCAQARQTAYASLAPLVFQHEADDPRAAALLQAAVDELAALVQALDPSAALPVVCSGSIARRLQTRLPAALGARCVEPAGDAADGALHLLRAAVARSAG
ncbi:BadF/BadG/BcrA/BcrD ATPase family protein [Ideonella sp.]|uniref:BadF/BadG/BcrA/BcrD ATPase family protein n=1 Tax=Ideonella sp. TaxID=1929293 RepID=UPI002B46A63F|nr:BadF/BadG/BcrA/BcrD ATPase family protein [Ideonella sp.]HJV71378.1 BadF/BadG/BcrA/BcrD ATPase family protein [Ideonella sp.]